MMWEREPGQIDRPIFTTNPAAYAKEWNTWVFFRGEDRTECWGPRGQHYESVRLARRRAGRM